MASPSAIGVAAPHLPGFNNNTRQRRVNAGSTQTRTVSTGGTFTVDAPRVGILTGVLISVVGTFNTLTGNPNVLGISSVVRRVRLRHNAGFDIFNLSGPSYHWLLAPYMDFPGHPHPQTTARTIIASAGAINLDMYIPVIMNLRDAVGVQILGSEQALITLIWEWESDANLASTTLTFTTQPVARVTWVVCSAPLDPRDMPDTSLIHQILEDLPTVPSSATGTLYYTLPRGGVQYLSLISGIVQATVVAAGAALGMGVAGVDAWTRAQFRLQSADYLYDFGPADADAFNPLYRYLARYAGVIPLDFMSSAGLGFFDEMRDIVDTTDLTMAELVVSSTLAAGGNMYSARRVLISRPYGS